MAYHFGIRLGEGALSRSQCQAATSMLRWRMRTSGAFVAATFIPPELNAAVASVTNVTCFRTRRRLRRGTSRYIADLEGCRTYWVSNPRP
jgi:hypothetical protein